MSLCKLLRHKERRNSGGDIPSFLIRPFLIRFDWVNRCIGDTYLRSAASHHKWERREK